MIWLGKQCFDIFLPVSVSATGSSNTMFFLPDHELLALWWRWMWCRVWFWFALLFVCAVGEKCLHIFLILIWLEQVNRSWWNIWKSDYEHILTLLTQILRIKVDRCILWTQFFLLWVNLGSESFQQKPLLRLLAPYSGWPRCQDWDAHLLWGNKRHFPTKTKMSFSPLPSNNEEPPKKDCGMWIVDLLKI